MRWGWQPVLPSLTSSRLYYPVLTGLPYFGYPSHDMAVVFLSAHQCSFRQLQTIFFPSWQFAVVLPVDLVLIVLGVQDHRVLLLGYLPTYDAWCCGCWGWFSQQRTSVASVHYLGPHTVETGLISFGGTSHSSNEPCLKLRLSYLALAITLSVA